MNKFLAFTQDIPKLENMAVVSSTVSINEFNYISNLNCKNYHGLKDSITNSIIKNRDITIAKNIYYNEFTYELTKIVLELKIYSDYELDVSDLLNKSMDYIKNNIKDYITKVLDEVFLSLKGSKILVKEAREYATSYFYKVLLQYNDVDVEKVIAKTKRILVNGLMRFYNQYKSDAYKAFLNIFCIKNILKDSSYITYYTIKYEGNEYPIFLIPIKIKHNRYSFFMEYEHHVKVNLSIFEYLSTKLGINYDLKQIIKIDDIEETFKKIYSIFGTLEDFDSGAKLEITKDIYVGYYENFYNGVDEDYIKLKKIEKNLESIETIVIKSSQNYQKEDNLIDVKDMFSYESINQLSIEQIKVLESFKDYKVKSVMIDSFAGTGKKTTAINLIFNYLIDNKKVLYLANDVNDIKKRFTNIFDSIRSNLVHNPILDLTNLQDVGTIINDSSTKEYINDSSILDEDDKLVMTGLKDKYKYDKFIASKENISNELVELRCQLDIIKLEYREAKTKYLTLVKGLVKDLDIDYFFVDDNYDDIENVVENRLKKMLDIEKLYLSIDLNRKLIGLFSKYYTKDSVTFNNLSIFTNIFKRKLSFMTRKMLFGNAQSLTDILNDLDNYEENKTTNKFLKGFFADKKASKYFFIKYSIRDIKQIKLNIDIVYDEINEIIESLKANNLVGLGINDIKDIFRLNENFLNIDFESIKELSEILKKEFHLDTKDNVLDFKNMLKEIYDMREIYQSKYERYRVEMLNINYLEIKTKVNSLIYKINSSRQEYNIFRNRIKKFDSESLEYTEHRIGTKYKIVRDAITLLDSNIANCQNSFEDIYSNTDIILDCFNLCIGNSNSVSYLPLKKDIFDLIVIDRAESVNMFTALPSIYRAKKVLILGDSSYIGDDSIMNFYKDNVNYKANLVNQVGTYKDIGAYANKTLFNNSIHFLKTSDKSHITFIEQSGYSHSFILTFLENSTNILSKKKVGLLFDDYSEVLKFNRLLLRFDDNGRPLKIDLELGSLDMCTFTVDIAYLFLFDKKEIDKKALVNLSLSAKEHLYIILYKPIEEYMNQNIREFFKSYIND